MKTIKQTYTISAPIGEVWKALVETKYIEAWGAAPAKMDDKAGFEFSLWGGDIYGKNLKVERNKLLVQEWVSKGWKNPSKVTFTLSHKDATTRIGLLH